MPVGGWFIRFAFYFGGLLVLTFAIALIIKSGVGAGPWDAVFVGLNKQLGLTVGTWVYVVQVSILLLNALLLREKPELLSFVTIFLRGLLLDMWLYWSFMDWTASGWESYAGMMAGTALLGVGISAYLSARFPKSPIDGLMLAIHGRFGFNVRLSRTIVEVAAVVIGFFLGGPIGVGTIVISLLLGPIIQATDGGMAKLLRFVSDRQVRSGRGKPG
ncbi:YitT family protein [Cohnella suwonensis]|uniref:YitT family protein n=1 Tax=Cohnella suwonensis TaxID=696072 RepID=A0ABW0M1X8_9BACL